jgi:glycosyltransferase involved in cell wall biosynthesis
MKMKTLWVNPTTMDTLLHNAALSNALKYYADLGHEVTLLSIRSKDASKIRNPKVRSVLVPLRYIPLVSSIMFAIILFFYLPILVIRQEPNQVVVFPDLSILSSLPSLLISKFKKTKFVLDIRSIPVETKGFQGFQTKFWYFVSLVIARNWFNGMTTLTSLMKSDICNDFQISPDKMGVWTSGVSESLFSPKIIPTARTPMRKKYGLDDKFVVFYHGIFTATRGLSETIQAIKLLAPIHPDIVFFLLGTGPYTTDLKNLIQQKGLQKNVIIHDPVEQLRVPYFISMSDICIIPLPDHPYWRAQSPLKLLEYLSMEKVVILTDIPSHREVICEAKCGIYIKSSKPIDIAEAIEYAYLNTKQLQECGKTGRDIVAEKYSWKNVAKDLENFLLSITNQ